MTHLKTMLLATAMLAATTSFASAEPASSRTVLEPWSSCSVPKDMLLASNNYTIRDFQVPCIQRTLTRDATHQ
jgi:hypothetical protein